jgi:hypothetical protein
MLHFFFILLIFFLLNKNQNNQFTKIELICHLKIPARVLVQLMVAVVAVVAVMGAQVA